MVKKMRVMLAPMEGVVDAPMRDFLTRIGGFDRCMTEFIRVVDGTYPRHVFTRYCPELLTDGRTAVGTPVYVQLLGSDCAAMASNARKAAKLGALGIDINFGCPSKTVNQRDGGSAVLREPHRVFAILAAVRDAVPNEIPVTAKIRLGFDHADDFMEIIQAVGRSGVDELCVHARTKLQGYKPPAHWSRVAEARRYLQIPVIINGEIWSPMQAEQAQLASTCDDIMIGRGVIACPDLAQQILAVRRGEDYLPMTWSAVWEQVQMQALELEADIPKYAAARTKQWLVYLKGHYPEAIQVFEQLKRYKRVSEMAKHWESEKPLGN